MRACLIPMLLMQMYFVLWYHWRDLMRLTHKGIRTLTFPSWRSFTFPTEVALFFMSLPNKVPHLVSLYLAGVGLSLFGLIGGLFAYHVYLLLSGKTTISHMKVKLQYVNRNSS